MVRRVKTLAEIIKNVEDFVVILEEEMEWINKRIDVLEGRVDNAIDHIENMPDRMIFTKDEVGQMEELGNLVVHRTRLMRVINELKMALAI